MNFIHTTLNVGAEVPFSAIHITDTHIVLSDDRDDERKAKLAEQRGEIPKFTGAWELLKIASEMSKKDSLPILHTGDFIDFVSYANLDAVKKYVSENDFFMAAGNHEFSLYVGEAVEDAAYRNQSLARVQASFSNDIRFSSRVINGVNFIALDNSYYLIEYEQLEKLKKEVGRGIPTVLLVHTPLYEDGLYNFHRRLHEGQPTFLMNVPEEKTEYYDKNSREIQRADEITREAYDYITNTPLIKAVLCGHLHYDYDGEITPSLPQIVTGWSTIRRIDFK